MVWHGKKKNTHTHTGIDCPATLQAEFIFKVSCVYLKTTVEGVKKLTNFDAFDCPCLTSLDINHLAYWKMDRKEMESCLNELKG